MKFWSYLKTFWEILKESLINFYDDDIFNYSGSIAFFTIFSLPGVLIIVVVIAGFFFGEQAVSGELYLQIKDVVGPESADQIQEVIEGVSSMKHTYFATLIGIATILFGATSVFISIQDGLNASWGLRPKPKRFALKFILNRLLSFAMVVSIGFLMLVSLTVDALLVLFNDLLNSFFSGESFVIIETLQYVTSTLLIVVIFLLIYKILPNANVKLKYLLPGTIIATLLFIAGKYLIGLYLGNSTLGTAYGAAGSLVVLLIWVYYSSLVLLYGAELIDVYIRKFDGHIQPDSGTVKLVTKEVKPRKR